jgi:hypothetical protein
MPAIAILANGSAGIGAMIAAKKLTAFRNALPLLHLTFATLMGTLLLGHLNHLLFLSGY